MEEADFRLRCLIVLHASSRAPRFEVSLIARFLVRDRSTVYRVLRRYKAEGFAGLVDHRSGNGERKVDEAFLARLAELVSGRSTEFGWMRPTWTREMLVRQVSADTRIGVSVRTMGRALRLIGARWKRGRPCVSCPWSSRRRRERLGALRSLVKGHPGGEVVVYEDEVDIHLNPKMGPDWMLGGQQKRVETPGRNVKRYLAATLNPDNGEVTWVEATTKSGLLFIALLERLRRRYRRHRRIHLILDNFVIHQSRRVNEYLASLAGKIELHFLPPYCPDENRIEGLWKELPANVTRNHSCDGIDQLMDEVRSFMRDVEPYPGSKPSLRRERGSRTARKAG